MEINELNFNVDLETILQELRNQLAINHIPYLQKEPKQSRNSLQIQCPYHSDGQERNRSAGIRKSDGMFHCFACGEVHSLPEVISHCFGKRDMMFGWKWLIKNFATVSVEERDGVVLDYSRGSVRDMGVRDYVSEEELDSYRYEHPYWEKRRITEPWLLELFDLGYDKKTKCITFPNFDENGNCVFVARRSVKSKMFNYPPDVEKPLYGLWQLKQLDTFPESIIVCESMLDALTVWQYGKYAIALNGLCSDKQLAQLRKLPCREIILALDNDKAGIKAREKIRRAITNKLVYFYEIPQITREDGSVTKDINDLEKEEFLNLKKYL